MSKCDKIWLKIFFVAFFSSDPRRVFVNCHPSYVIYPYASDAVDGADFGSVEEDDSSYNEIDTDSSQETDYNNDYSSPELTYEEDPTIITYSANELYDSHDKKPKSIVTSDENQLTVTYSMTELNDTRVETGPLSQKPIVTYGTYELSDNGGRRSRARQVHSRTNYGDESRGIVIPLNEDLPIECKYNTSEFPIPKMKIIKKGRRVSDIKCQEYTWRLMHEITDVMYYRQKCELKAITSGIAGGEDSRMGDFPHMGALYWKVKGDDSIPLCGSSLISPMFALTAAHCAEAEEDEIKVYHLLSPEPSYIRFGAINLNKQYKHALNVNIKKIIKYDQYKSGYNHNDIALIQLANEVPMSPYIRPACLWHGSLGQHRRANITGWGRKYDYDPNSSQEHLQYAEVNFMNSKKCSSLTKLKLIHSQFCAGIVEGGQDTCQGDSGGPIQVQESQGSHGAIVYHVVGVTSFGGTCAEPENPSVYTNVTSFLCWIEERVWPNERNSKC